MQLPTAQAGWRNISNPSQQEVFTQQMCYPVKCLLHPTRHTPTTFLRTFVRRGRSSFVVEGPLPAVYVAAVAHVGVPHGAIPITGVEEIGIIRVRVSPLSPDTVVVAVCVEHGEDVVILVDEAKREEDGEYSLGGDHEIRPTPPPRPRDFQRVQCGRLNSRTSARNLEGHFSTPMCTSYPIAQRASMAQREAVPRRVVARQNVC